MITRRRLFGLLPAFALSLHAEAQSQPPRFFHRKPKKVPPAPQPFLYIGVDTAAGIGKGIYACRFNTATGQLSPPILAAETFRPSFFAMGPNRNGRQFLYVGNEGNDKTSFISSFAIQPADGGLHQVGKVSSGFSGPAYVSVDATGQSVYAACYGGSGVSSFRIQPDGTLSEAVDRIDFHKPAFGHPGPNTSRQDAPHPHCATFSPDDRFLVVNDLGNDQISIFPVDTTSARLGTPHSFATAPGSGPRHVAFHPNGRWMYSINEMGYSIDQFLWIATHGKTPEALLTNTDNTVRTTAADFHGANTAAELAVAPNGYFLYASNRGENSLVVFSIDQTTGALTFVQRVSCGGTQPRHFTLDPTGRWLLCGNQASDTIAVFARNEGTGMLSGPVQSLPVDAPMFMLFA